MEKRTQKFLKVSGIALGSLLATFCVVIAIVVNVVFTSDKLTPMVLQVANQNLNAKLDMKEVDLTFFSTFPRFGLRLTDGTLVSKALRDTMWQRTDTLLSFQKAVLELNVMDYVCQRKVSVHRLELDSARIYAYKDKAGHPNWDIMKTDNASDDSTSSDSVQYVNELDIKRVAIRNAIVTMDDRDTQIFANLWDMNLDLKAHLKKEHSVLALDFSNKNVLFWQKGQLLLHHIATRLKTDVELDGTHQTLRLNDALFELNGTKFGVKGTLRRDTVAQGVDVDLRYGLYASSLETILHIIPESVLKKSEVEAHGEVTFKGTLQGIYGKGKLPLATLDVCVKEASAQYAGLPYGIDRLDANFSGQLDLMRQQPSFLNLKIFSFKGAKTDVWAEGKVDNLLVDPEITFHTRSTVDLNALSQAFPLQEGVSMEGKLKADVGVRCRWSSIKQQNWGRIQAKGKILTDKVLLRDTNTNFELFSNASLDFVGNNWLGARALIQNLTLRAPRLKADMVSLQATVKTLPVKDTAQIAQVECRLALNKLKASLGDSLGMFCGKSTATLKLRPGDKNPTHPLVSLTMEADTLYCRMGNTTLGMDKAGIGVSAERERDSLWLPKGIVGFHRLFVRTPQCALPILMQKTAVTVGNKVIALRNATMRIGRSDLTATGAVYDLYGAMKHHQKLRAKLDISSQNLDCSQLIHSLSFPADTVVSQTVDTTAVSSSLFVIPENLDFELQTNLKRVTYEKLEFTDVYGDVDIRNQSVHLKELTMKGMGADMNTTLVYQAKNRRQGFAGFDFRLHNINIAKLVDFSPSLDTIVPMLRSFEGTVDFKMAAAASLDSCMNIQIPSLRSAIHVKGDSLVLMDGETFAEISKKFFFKNKKKNLIDSIAVNISIKDGNVTVYPFEITMDRYRAAVGGTQGLDMKFDYHISILKSPIPFKLGLNISGTLDDMKFRLGKARYKDAVTPAEVHKVDSAIVHMGQQISDDFKRWMRR